MDRIINRLDYYRRMVIIDYSKDLLLSSWDLLLPNDRPTRHRFSVNIRLALLIPKIVCLKKWSISKISKMECSVAEIFAISPRLHVMLERTKLKFIENFRSYFEHFCNDLFFPILFSSHIFYKGEVNSYKRYRRLFNSF